MLFTLSIISLIILVLAVVFKIYIVLTTAKCTSQTCLVGKTAIVTGANTGIGYETALDFAKRGARVILACRDEKRAQDACAKIIEETGNQNVRVQLIDLDSFESVRAFAKKIKATEDRLDILVNNAGIGGIGDKKSKDGHVSIMQINYFSAFLLTNLLIGLLIKTEGSRVVNVSSIMAKVARNFDLNRIDEFLGNSLVYTYSKLCNILFTIELAKKLEGTNVTTYSLHPGAVNSEIFRNNKGVVKLVVDFLKGVFFKTSGEGAQTSTYCSVAKGIEKYSGEHFDGCKRVQAYNGTRVPGLSKKLWDLTEEIVELEPHEVLI